jgi:hypothetical protein
MAKRRLSDPLLEPSPKLTGWSLRVSVPPAKPLTSATIVNSSIERSPMSARTACASVSYKPRPMGAAGTQFFRPSQTPHTGSASAESVRSKRRRVVRPATAAGGDKS